MSDAKLPEPTPVPKITKAGPSKALMKWIIFTIVTFGVVMGAGAYNKFVRKPAQEDKTIIRKHTGVADPMIARSLVGDPVPEPDPKPEPEPAPEPEEVEVIMPQKRILPPPPRADELINQPTLNDEEERILAMLNNARRGKVVRKSSKELYGSTLQDEYNMAATDWGMEKTRASFPLTMDRVVPITSTIPALLATDIHSEKGGVVRANVEHHVYGGHGRNVLIPAGTEAVGYLTPLEKVGETRIAVTWIRLITPDGINIHTVNAEMADAMGRTGMTGYIDEKMWDKYGIPLLVTTLQIAAAAAFPVKSDNQAVLVEGYGSSVANMGQTVLDERIQMKPVVEIPAGSRINISIMKDVWFPEPEKSQRDVQAQAVPKKEK